MKYLIPLFALALIGPAADACGPYGGLVAAPKPVKERVVELTICLDTSGSMNGLIDSARQRIWAIVNDLALAKPAPRLRIALVAYGGGSYDPKLGWVKVMTPFTDDLDKVSAQLFALDARGSTEFVGRALQTAMTFDWQNDPSALQLIVIAGNESADQDTAVPFRDMCKKAIARNIMINSIYCGESTHADARGWQEIARLSDGHYAAINPNKIVTIATPFDEKLAALSTSLNGTYVAFGAKGRAGYLAQKLQDKNAAGLNGGVAAERAQSKANGAYTCAWCLVDATRNGQIKLADVKDTDLPKELKGKTKEEIQAHLDAKFAERKKIKDQVAEMHKQRRAWLDAEMKKLAGAGEASFDSAVRKALRAQASAKGYKFEE